MIMMRLNSHDHSCFGYRRKSCCVIQLEQPFCCGYNVYTFTNGTAGSADYTTTSQTVTVPAGATTGTGVPTTADTIENPMRFTLSLELRYWNNQ
jgi:hypothetical protein